MKQIVIIGAGIFGSILAAKLRRLNYPFTLVDCKQTLRASKAGACLLKREWSNGLHPDKEQCDVLYTSAMATLHQLYPSKIRKFNAEITFEILRPENIIALSKMDYLKSPVKNGIEVFEYDQIDGVDTVNGIAYGKDRTYEGILYIANGYWLKELLPKQFSAMRGLVGTSFIVKSNPSVQSCGIQTYAPYRQMIWFPVEGNATYFSDGTAIKMENYNNQYMINTIERGNKVGFDTRFQFDTGVRPYLNAQNDRTGTYLKLSPNAYVATGGAKIGTLLAAIYANNFCEDNDIL